MALHRINSYILFVCNIFVRCYGLFAISIFTLFILIDNNKPEKVYFHFVLFIVHWSISSLLIDVLQESKWINRSNNDIRTWRTHRRSIFAIKIILLVLVSDMFDVSYEFSLSLSDRTIFCTAKNFMYRNQITNNFDLLKCTK